MNPNTPSETATPMRGGGEPPASPATPELPPWLNGLWARTDDEPGDNTSQPPLATGQADHGEPHRGPRLARPAFPEEHPAVEVPAPPGLGPDPGQWHTGSAPRMARKAERSAGFAPDYIPLPVPDGPMPPPEPIARYVWQKKLPEAFIKQLGVYELGDSLAIPYYDEGGNQAALRLRHPPGAATRFSWKPGGTMMPYGLWQANNRDARAIVLVEGESDAHSMWHMGLPTLGIPGSLAFKQEWVSRCVGPRPVYIHRENDDGGQRFVDHVAGQLSAAGHTQAVHVFSASHADPGCKDISDLYARHGRDMARHHVTQLITNAPRYTPPAVGEPAISHYCIRELGGTPLERPPMIVDNMLTPGLTLLAGAPKKGKSWLALHLALCVAAGRPFLGRDTVQGQVLYLDLESRRYRVQERATRLCPGELPHGLFMAHQAPRMEDGLYQGLSRWAQAQPRPRLVIVDTMGRIKGQGRGRENAYEADTRMLGEAQRFALDHGLSLLMVHHLRKTIGGFKEPDVYERVSGSTGITGVCDAVMVLDAPRGQTQAQLYLDGRDIPPQQLALQFDNGVWTLLSEDGAKWAEWQRYEDSPLPGAVRKLMDGRESWEGTATELSRALEKASDGACEVGPREVTRELLGLQKPLREQEGVSVSVRIKDGRRLALLTRETPPDNEQIASA